MRKLAFETLEKRQMLSTDPTLIDHSYVEPQPFEVDVEYEINTKQDVFDHIVPGRGGRGAMWLEYFSDEDGKPGEVIDQVQAGDTYWMALRATEWDPTTAGFGGFAADITSSDGMSILDTYWTPNMPLFADGTINDNDLYDFGGSSGFGVGSNMGNLLNETFGWVWCLADYTAEQITVGSSVRQGGSRIAPSPAQSWGRHEMNYPQSFSIDVMPNPGYEEPVYETEIEFKIDMPDEVELGKTQTFDVLVKSDVGAITETSFGLRWSNSYISVSNGYDYDGRWKAMYGIGYHNNFHVEDPDGFGDGEWTKIGSVKYYGRNLGTTEITVVPGKLGTNTTEQDFLVFDEFHYPTHTVEIVDPTTISNTHQADDGEQIIDVRIVAPEQVDVGEEFTFEVQMAEWTDDKGIMKASVDVDWDDKFLEVLSFEKTDKFEFGSERADVIAGDQLFDSMAFKLTGKSWPWMHWRSGEAIGDNKFETFAVFTAIAKQEGTTFIETGFGGHGFKIWGRDPSSVGSHLVKQDNVEIVIGNLPAKLPELDPYWAWQPLVVDPPQIIGPLLEGEPEPLPTHWVTLDKYPVYTTTPDNLPLLVDIAKEQESPVWILVDEVFSSDDDTNEVLEVPVIDPLLYD